MASPSERKRLGRSPDAHQLRQSLFNGAGSKRIGTHVWPDVYELLAKDAAAHGLTVSGMAHQVFRRYYNLPPIP